LTLAKTPRRPNRLKNRRLTQEVKISHALPWRLLTRQLEGARAFFMTDMQVREKPAARTKTCALCGTVFDCSISTGCWCSAKPYRLPMPAPGSTDDCMCPIYLRAEAAKRRAG
jgi:hypothetical protein